MEVLMYLDASVSRLFYKNNLWRLKPFHHITLFHKLTRYYGCNKIKKDEKIYFSNLF